MAAVGWRSEAMRLMSLTHRGVEALARPFPVDDLHNLQWTGAVFLASCCGALCCLPWGSNCELRPDPTGSFPFQFPISTTSPSRKPAQLPVDKLTSPTSLLIMGFRGPERNTSNTEAAIWVGRGYRLGEGPYAYLGYSCCWFGARPTSRLWLAHC